MVITTKRISQRFRALSVLFACLVVCVHIPRTSDFASRLFIQLTDHSLSFIAVPFFFFSSGFFLAKDCEVAGWYKRALKARLHSLVVPFLIFNLVWVCYLRYGHIFDLGVLWGFVSPFNYPWLRPTWFMRTLVFFVLISPLLLRLIKGATGCIIGLVILYAAYLYYYVVYFRLEDPSGAFHRISFLFYGGWLSVEGLFYFACGFAMRLHGDALLNIIRRSRAWLVALSGGAVFVCAVFLTRCCGDSVLRLTIAPAGLLFFLIANLHLDWMARYSYLSFPIYLIYGCIIGHVDRIITRNSILVFVIVVVLSVLIAVGVRRLMPRVGSIVFGGRL